MSTFKPVQGFELYECTKEGAFRTVGKQVPVFPDRATGGSKIYLSDGKSRLLMSIEGLVQNTWGAEANVAKPDPKAVKDEKKVETPAPVADGSPAEAVEPKKQAVLIPLTPAQEEYAKKVIAAKTSEAKRIWLLYKFGLTQDQVNDTLKTKKGAYIIWLYGGSASRQAKAEKVKLD
jgi:hypothetical protein